MTQLQLGLVVTRSIKQTKRKMLSKMKRSKSCYFLFFQHFAKFIPSLALISSIYNKHHSQNPNFQTLVCVSFTTPSVLVLAGMELIFLSVAAVFWI